MKSFARGVEQPQFLCMHSPGRELIVTEMHQSPARLHGATLDQVHASDQQRRAPSFKSSAGS
jgi:hypothetical protein